MRRYTDKKVDNRPIPPRYLQVLLYIAKNGPKTRYQIEKETHLPHSTIFDVVKFFLENKILREEKIGKTNVGLDKKLLKLTFQGVCTSLKYADFNDYGKIFEKWKHLSPFLLNKYNYLVQKIGKQEAGMFFYRYVRDINHHKPNSDRELFENSVLETILWFRDAFFYNNPEELTKFNNWVKIFKEDSDFTTIIKDFIKDEVRNAKTYLEWSNFLNEIFRHLQM